MAGLLAEGEGIDAILRHPELCFVRSPNVKVRAGIAGAAEDLVAFELALELIHSEESGVRVEEDEGEGKSEWRGAGPGSNHDAGGHTIVGEQAGKLEGCPCCLWRDEDTCHEAIADGDADPTFIWLFTDWKVERVFLDRRRYGIDCYGALP
jgi:hypothetical protein